MSEACPFRENALPPEGRPGGLPYFTRRAFLAMTALNLMAADYRIIDPHVHVWKHDPAFPFAQGANVPARDAAPETLLEKMKANGVERTVIIQVIHYR